MYKGYLSLNLVFIITIHSYATKASSQYMNIKLRRPYTEAILMMSIETFYQNNTYYLISHPETQIKYLPEYVSNTLLIEEEILDFEKNGPRFIFSKYIHKIINYNSENFCDELETANESNSGCSTFDNGFFKNGLRASQFRAITNFQTLAKKFIKDEGKSHGMVERVDERSSDAGAKGEMTWRWFVCVYAGEDEVRGKGERREGG